jgi:hypothetical protein
MYYQTEMNRQLLHLQVYTPAIDPEQECANVHKLQPTFLRNATDFWSSLSSETMQRKNRASRACGPIACFGSFSSNIYIAQLPSGLSSFSVLKSCDVGSRAIALAAHATLPMLVVGTAQNKLELLHVSRR